MKKKNVVKLLVLSEDDHEPVPDVRVDFVLIGEDGGDGGFNMAVTDAEGYAESPPTIWAGRYQVYLSPPTPSEFDSTSFTDAKDLLTVGKDGEWEPKVFELRRRKNSE